MYNRHYYYQPQPRTQSHYYPQDLTRSAYTYSDYAPRPNSAAPQYRYPQHDRERGLFKHAIGNIFQYSKCTGRKKAVCVSHHSLSLTNLPLMVITDRDQLFWASARTERVYK